ncbi:MAG: hypothetical protein GF400_09005 [Candidatus Eisenbacteria bacterium]|nr:hypothetical protein [Candidatus Eisenbacteria bacterium]
MNKQNVQEQLEIIRAMVARSRRETAESGRFFVWLGSVALGGLVVIALLEAAGRNGLVLPTLVALAVVSGVIGYLSLARVRSRAPVRSYASTVSGLIWFAVGLANVIVALVLPLVGAYDWTLVPMLTCIILGSGVFSTGAIFEMPAVSWCAVAWWGAGVGMAFVHGPPRAILMATAIGLGWILPGILFGRETEGKGEDV